MDGATEIKMVGIMLSRSHALVTISRFCINEKEAIVSREIIFLYLALVKRITLFFF